MSNYKTLNSISTTKNIVLVGLMSAIFCILAPISLPLPFTPVPVSLGIFVVYINSYVLKPKFATISTIIYILLGLIGLPVFSGYSGGVGKLFGPTGGYILSYIPTTFIVSFFFYKFLENRIMHILGMLIGLSVCLLFGTIWFSIQTGNSFLASLSLCVYPFILGDIIKIIISSIIGPKIQKVINKIS